MPPIYQPEIAADAIVWAACHDRREIQVGMPTVIAVEGNKVLAGFMDRYLARTGYDAQQTDEPVEPPRQDNLWEPLPGDGVRTATLEAALPASVPTSGSTRIEAG